MSQQNEIEQIELSIEEAQKLVGRAATARRLADNPDFKSLILEGYFVTEAARLTTIVSHPNMAPHKDAIWNDIMGVGSLRRFLSTCITMGDVAQKEISDAHDALDDIRAEEAGE